MVVRFTNNISNPPINSPTASEMTMTAPVSLIVSSRVGQVTFNSSERTSVKNLPGAMFGSFGAVGFSMNSIIKDASVTTQYQKYKY